MMVASDDDNGDGGSSGDDGVLIEYYEYDDRAQVKVALNIIN